MAGTEDVFDLSQLKCYKCKQSITQAAHRVHSEWFCVECWAYVTSNGLIHLYESEIAPYDWDLARKDNLITD